MKLFNFLFKLILCLKIVITFRRGTTLCINQWGTIELITFANSIIVAYLIIKLSLENECLIQRLRIIAMYSKLANRIIFSSGASTVSKVILKFKVEPFKKFHKIKK